MPDKNTRFMVHDVKSVRDEGRKIIYRASCIRAQISFFVLHPTSGFF